MACTLELQLTAKDVLAYALPFLGSQERHTTRAVCHAWSAELLRCPWNVAYRIELPESRAYDWQRICTVCRQATGVSLFASPNLGMGMAPSLLEDDPAWDTLRSMPWLRNLYFSFLQTVHISALATLPELDFAHFKCIELRGPVSALSGDIAAAVQRG